MNNQVIIVNFKTYPQATGEKAVTLAKECEQAAKEHGYDIRVAVQATDIYRVAQAVSIPVYAQHDDPVEPGATTGWVTPQAIKAAGAAGALLNHSERRIKSEDIIAATVLMQKEGLDTIVLAENAEEIKKLDAHIKPDFFGVEPAELIGGDISVSTAQPELVKASVQATQRPVLIGAGVKTYEDLRIGNELHAKGIVLASGIVKAPHRDQAFRKLLTPH